MTVMAPLLPARKAKVLFVTRHTPLPWEDGAGAYLHDIARFLSQNGFAVDILWLRPHEQIRWTKLWRLPLAFDRTVRLHLPKTLRVGGFYVFPAILWLPFKAKALHWVKRLLGPLGTRWRGHRRTSAGATPGLTARPSENWMAPPSPAELDLVQAFAARHSPDVVIASYAWMCPVFALRSLRHARHVCLAHDIAWKRAAMTAGTAATDLPPAVTRDEESGWLREAETIIAISEPDAVDLWTLAPQAHITVAPKALQGTANVGQSPSVSLLFVGSGNAFNAEGLTWFLEEVWPKVLHGLPQTTLDVCGSVDRAVSLRPASVTFHGMVTDLAPFYARTAVAIIPLLQSTGLNIKLIEAAAFGRPFVMTSISLRGAPFFLDVAVVADSSGEFAEAVLRLLRNPEVRAHSAARVLRAVSQKLASEACYGPLAALLRH